MKQNILYYFFFFLFSFNCPAHFTGDIASYAMSLYLHQLAEEKIKTLNSQYTAYISAFMQSKKKETEQKLSEEEKVLNSFFSSLSEQISALNADIETHNKALVVYEQKIKERDNIQAVLHRLSAQKKLAREELKLKAGLVIQDINNFAGALNDRAASLNEQENKTRRLKKFYQNKGYMSDPLLVRFKAKWQEWEKKQQLKWDLYTAEYNNKKMELSQNEDESRFIAEQKALVETMLKNLENLIQDLGILIEQYNKEIKTPCATKRCEKTRLETKETIKKQKTEKLERENDINNKVSEINQRQKEYNRKQKKYSAELRSIRIQMTAFSENWVKQRGQKAKDYERKIQEQKQKAEKKQISATESLSQSQKAFRADYGEDVVSFTRRFSRWMSAVQPVFTASAKEFSGPREEDILQTANKDLCKQIAPATGDLSADESGKTLRARICNRAMKILISFEDFHAVLAENKLLQEKLNKKNQEIQNMEEEIKQLGMEIDLKKSFVSAQKQEYKEQADKKQAELKMLSTQMGEDLSRQIQIRKEAYENKIRLLEREYDLINTLLFARDMPKNLIAKHTYDFESARETFNKGVKALPPGFKEPYELFSAVLKRGEQGFCPSPSSSEGYYKLKEEEKRNFIAFWMQSGFIVDFLSALEPKLADLSADYKKGNHRFLAYQAANADSSLDVKKGCESQNKNRTLREAFLETLFLEGFYNHIPVWRKGGLPRYQLAFDDRVFWILPDGRLKALEGVYR